MWKFRKKEEVNAPTYDEAIASLRLSDANITASLQTLGKDLKELQLRNSTLESTVSELKNRKEQLDAPATVRLVEIEAKLGKLWTLLTTNTPTGQEKLNKQGKQFGSWLKK